MNDKPLEVGEIGVTCNRARVIGLLAEVLAVDCGATITRWGRVDSRDFYLANFLGYGVLSIERKSLRRLTDPDANQSQSTDQDIPVKA